ncbi:MAG: BlaI/MecI/CopY family transcriptional regulator [Candidatus Omnitrophica bacterium]|nr:BlaI/MecI/CopY family transcriptional regulator [Candidatus Omnitrophota bacterium]
MMNVKDLSPSEIYVLNIIYELGSADIYEILNRVANEKKWKYTTVLTLATRLFDKGHLEKRKVSKRYVYSPKFSRFDSFRMIMDRLFGTTLLNDPSPMINYLIRSKKLTKKEQKLLQELLEEENKKS